MIFYDGLVISFASKDYIVVSEEYKDIESTIEELIKEYQEKKDLNDKILKNDLLAK